jgi:hypothetical protein
VIIFAVLDYLFALAVWTFHAFLLVSASLFYFSRLN